jgi:Polyketide cyclase / dehydrase and lipid transport
VPVDASAETVIRRPRGEVGAYVFDPRNDERWIGGIRSARPLGDGPTAVGSRVRREASFLGRRIEYVNEVVELEPDSKLRMRSLQAPFPMDITYELADAEAGTSMRIRVQGEAGRFYRLATPVLSTAVRRSLAGDLKRLRRILEDGPATRASG